MNSNFLYSLVGLLAGSVATAGLLVLSTKVAPQAVTSLDRSSAPSVILAQTPSGGLSGQPGRLMMQSNARFIIMMIPHHQDAVAMADLALTRAQHPEIKQLAQAIKTTQTQEIEQMRTWYKQWYGSPVPTWTAGMGRGMGMGMGMGRQGNPNCPLFSTNAPSASTGASAGRSNSTATTVPGAGCGRGNVDLAALKAAADFDRTFIKQMIPHHQMAVRMTHMIQNSTRPEMQSLAAAIVTTQTREIDQMQQWYQQWYR